MASSSLWQRFQRYFLEHRELGFSLDISRMKFPGDLFEKMHSQIGGTKETRNGMLKAEAKFAAKGLQFARHAVAVTGVGSAAKSREAYDSLNAATEQIEAEQTKAVPEDLKNKHFPINPKR